MSEAPLPDLGIAPLRAAYRAGRVSPTQLVTTILMRSASFKDRNLWIDPPDPAAVLARARALEHDGMASRPLYGIPFVVKDNIDVAGMPTTAACSAFAHVPQSHAVTVQRLLDAGAILIGKTNLDQFATGLNGTRSDYGVCRNAFDPTYIAGGSSSGSAVAVALGLASFALGTDTAGSGRVPAAFNNLVGVKPTRGLLSTRGVLPACRSLDCVSIFSRDCHDALTVFDLLAHYDAADPLARHPQPGPLPGFGAEGLRIAVPKYGQLQVHCDGETVAAFDRAANALAREGAELIDVDITPFLEAALLLYEGPWVAERYLAIRAFFEEHGRAIHPVVRDIIERGRGYSAADAFDARYTLATLQRRAELVIAGCDALMLPTAPRHPTVQEMLDEPVALNAQLGRYTNFVNLFDMAAVAVPAGLRTNGLPVGVTLLAPAHSDRFLMGLGAQLQPVLNTQLGRGLGPVQPFEPSATAPPTSYAIAVVGAHLRGLVLNHELTARGGRFLREARTAPHYRLLALEGRVARPGLVLAAAGGASIEAELWALPAAQFGSFLAGIAAPLGLGRVILEDGEDVIGFMCEGSAAAHARDITEFGGWRAWLAHLSQPPGP